MNNDHPEGFESLRKEILNVIERAVGYDCVEECFKTFLDLMVKRGDLLSKTKKEVFQKRDELFGYESCVALLVQLALDGLGTTVEDELTEMILDFVYDEKIEEGIEWSDDGAPDTHPHLREE